MNSAPLPAPSSPTAHLFDGAQYVNLSGSPIHISQNNNLEPWSKEKKGFEMLQSHVAPETFLDSSEGFSRSRSRCYPNTRVAVLQRMTSWARSSTPILAVSGPAGSGKSAICKTFAENCRDAKMLLSASFLSRAMTGQNYNRPLIPTIAYQLACAIPPVLSHIDQAILLDPFIFGRELETQVSALIIQPIIGAFREDGEARGSSWPNVIVVDGLDEYANPEMQMRLLFALQKVAQIPAFSVRILISSRPESHLVRSFDVHSLDQMTLHLALDESINPSVDIAYFLRSNLHEVKKSHRLKQLIPVSWPDERDMNLLVEKSSGQFIYIASVVKYVSADRGDPVQRLQGVCALETPSTDNAYAELDALYRHVFSSLRHLQMVLNLLSFQLLDPAPTTWNTFPDPKLSFDERWQMMLPADCCTSQDVQGITTRTFCDLLADLDGIVLTISESPLIGWQYRFLHASLPDFLFDEARSGRFYIKASIAHAALASNFIQCLSRNKCYQNYHVLWTRLCHHIRNASLDFPILQSALKNFNVISAAAGSQSYSKRQGWYFLPDFLQAIFSNLSQFKGYDAGNILHHFKAQIDAYHRSEVAKYAKDETMEFLLAMVAAKASLCPWPLGFHPHALSRHLFWSRFQPTVNIHAMQSLDESSLDLYSLLSEGFLLKSLLLLRDFLLDPLRSREFHVGKKKFAKAAMLGLQSLVSSRNIRDGSTFDLVFDNTTLGIDKNPLDGSVTAALRSNLTIADKLERIPPDVLALRCFFHGVIAPILNLASPSRRLARYIQSPKVQTLVSEISDFDIAYSPSPVDVVDDFMQKYRQRWSLNLKNLLDKVSGLFSSPGRRNTKESMCRPSEHPPDRPYESPPNRPYEFPPDRPYEALPVEIPRRNRNRNRSSRSLTVSIRSSYIHSNRSSDTNDLGSSVVQSRSRASSIFS